jgi:hypothetical protein
VNALFDLHPPPQGTWPENHSPLFDYLELAVTEIIFSYTAIEGAVNELITPSSKYHRPQKGGRPPVVMVGADIERKISLDEKLKKALPEILNIKSPAGETIWHKYSDLQELRDRPVHLKSIDRKASGPEDETVWGRLLRLGADDRPFLSDRSSLAGSSKIGVIYSLSRFRRPLSLYLRCKPTLHNPPLGGCT